MNVAPNFAIILSGPSGVGKDTVLDAWMERNPILKRVVATTSRPPRPGEVDGHDYHFVSELDFVSSVKDFAFLEYKVVHGNFYGTPYDGIREILVQGKIPILKIDVQGAVAVMEKGSIDLLSVFLLPPNEEVLRQRLTGRSSDSIEAIEKRMLGAQEELRYAHHYQHQIVNHVVEDVVDQLEVLLQQKQLLIVDL